MIADAARSCSVVRKDGHWDTKPHAHQLNHASRDVLGYLLIRHGDVFLSMREGKDTLLHRVNHIRWIRTIIHLFFCHR
jgi:hypothetical protein